MIDRINGEELSNIYRKSLPEALSFICLKINELVHEYNKKPLPKPYPTIELNPPISKDIWI